MITRQMTINDFVEVMAQNAALFPEYAALSLDMKKYFANANIITGTAKALVEDDGRIFVLFGTRYIGMPKGTGEVWCITFPNIRNGRKFTFLRQAKKLLKQQIDELGLQRIFANSTISVNFLKHLGFEESTMPIWVKII